MSVLDSAMEKAIRLEPMTAEEEEAFAENFEETRQRVERETRECEETGVGVCWDVVARAGLASRVDGRWEWC